MKAKNLFHYDNLPRKLYRHSHLKWNHQCWQRLRGLERNTSEEAVSPLLESRREEDGWKSVMKGNNSIHTVRNVEHMNHRGEYFRDIKKIIFEDLFPQNESPYQTQRCHFTYLRTICTIESINSYDALAWHWINLHDNSCARNKGSCRNIVWLKKKCIFIWATFIRTIKNVSNCVDCQSISHVRHLKQFEKSHELDICE